MRKFFTLFFLLVIFCSSGVFAQTDFTIGTGTGGNTGTTYPAPLQDYFEGSRAQYLFRASELTAAGMAAGNISAIKFNVTALNGYSGTIQQLTIKIGTTAANALSLTSWEPGTTTVFGPVDYTVTSGVNSFQFTTPFLWNGTSNIIIEICNGLPASVSDGLDHYTENPRVNWSTVSFTASHTYRADDAGNLCSTTTTTNNGSSTTRPNFIFTRTSATPCAGTPNAGTATRNPASVCVGQQFSLNATGVTDAGDLTIQWEQSTDNINFTPIAGANAPSYTGTQTVTTFYRLRVTCNNGGAFSTSNVVQVASPPTAAGVYTINNALPTDIAGRTFNSFNDAYNFIKCGITAPTVFNVIGNAVPGPYNEQLIMTAVPGTNATNTVTFKGDGNATIGFSATNSGERAVIKLKAADFIIFDSLIINANTGTYGYGVQLVNVTGGDGADNNVVRNCTINSSLSSTSTNFVGIVVSGSETDPIGIGSNVVADNNTFENNFITGGYYGVTLSATFTGGANGNNKILNNVIRDFYLTGIYIAGTYGTQVIGNRISRPSRTIVGEFTGILLTSQKSTSAVIAKNRIYNPFGGAPTSSSPFTGINFLNADGSTGAENFVMNNVIFAPSGNGNWVGIANTGSDYAYYLHNTIDLHDDASTANSTTRGFYQTTTAASLAFFNNLISITRGGNGLKHAIYLGSGALTGGMDNNNYYVAPLTGNNYTGYLSGNRRSIADWQTATSLEASSWAINPAFVDRSGLDRFPGNAAIDNKGLFIGVPDDDIYGIPRPANPDIGAYEFVPPACTTPPVTGPVVISPTSSCQNASIFLSMNIGPYGSAQTFQWQTSTTETGTYTDLGNALFTPDTTILAGSTLWYRVAVTCGSTTTFTTPILVTVYPALPAGIYTINSQLPTDYTGPGTGTNFQTFNAAKDAMACGILGKVTFNVDPGANSGPYVEQLILDSITGTSPTNNITFNGNGKIIKFNSTNSNERAVIKLRNADHIIFDSLIIDATGGNFGYGVQLIANADSNTISRCTILTPITNSTSFAGIVTNFTDGGLISTGNTFCDGNTFIGNTVVGGFYGATLVGSTTSANYVANNSYINNTFRDFYFAGLHLQGTLNTLVEGNDFSRVNVPPTNNPATVYGIFATNNPSFGLKIQRNRIHNFFTQTPGSTSVFYGINHTNADATTGNENEVSNNLIYNIEHNGSIYGLYNNGSDNVRYYHNTISIDNGNSNAVGASAGFYQTLTATGVEFKNNLITITRGGNALKHGIYLATSGSEVTADFNNYYINAGGSNNFTGYNGQNRSSLADWQLASNKDLNSLAVDPIYIDSATGNYMPATTPLNDKGTFAGVPVDINLVARPMTPPVPPATTPRPDIGAYEFNPPPCVSPILPGTASVTPNTSICLETPIHLTSVNHSPLGSITFQWFSSVDGVTYTPLSGILYSPDYDTLATTDTYYRLTVTCGGTDVFSNVVQVTLGDILPAGTYTISANPTTYPGGTNFQGFQSAVTAMQCGIGGKIVFNVAAGTYNEQIRIGNIRGVSPLRTVTFQAANNVASSVNLTFDATSAANNYTVKLDSTRYFIFKDLTISATNASFAHVVELATTASFDSILNCTINGPVTSVANSNLSGVYANALKGTKNVIRGNTISNGAYGIYYTGTGAGANLTEDHIIDSNIISGSYNYGIYTNFHKRLMLAGNNVTMSAPLSGLSYGIYSSDADSLFNIIGNKVTFNNTSSTVYGIYLNNSDSSATDQSQLKNNIVTSTGTNTGNLYGIYINFSHGHIAANNVVFLNNTGAIAQGLRTNSNTAKYWNNSINLTSTSQFSGVAGFFESPATGNIDIRNNIFSNQGGGRAMYVSNTGQARASDYNMLYTSGTVLVQRQTPAGNFNTLAAFNNASFWDVNSLVYEPAFANTELQPNLANPDVWAMHGRGVQIPGNNVDINNQSRPTTLTTGVPDLGAYEFFPTALPTVLTATPATPAPNTTQTFMYGTDTVMKVTWGATAPPSIQGRRYSGVVPQGLPAAMDSMYFYTTLTSPAGGVFPYDMQLFYIDPWQGSIPNQNQIGLGKTTRTNAWIVGFNSRANSSKKFVKETSLSYFDKFTGLVNPYAPPILQDRDSSNRGRRFWVAYPRNQLNANASQQMVLYLSAEEAANVEVKINGTSWVRNYTVGANSVLETVYLPKAGPDNAYITLAGLSDRGISITSDVPIVAYAHVIGNTSSGASMLMPVGVWGYEYRTLGITQTWGTGGYSYFYVVADNDNTAVEITTPAGIGLQNAAITPGTPFVVNLMKGEVYQVLASGTSADLTGSFIKSVANAQGICHPIASFSGSTRTQLACPVGGGSGGDFIMQQNFPSTAWGKRYLTAPTSHSSSASVLQTNIYRVAVKDPTTVVTRNGVPLTGLINNFYYQYNSGTADYIEADKPIMVAQFLTAANCGGGSGGVGDPEMIYLSPIEQGIDKVGFYRNTEEGIDVNYLTLIIPTAGLTSLAMFDNNVAFTPDYTFPHPQNALTGNNYTVVVKRWTAAKRQVRVSSDSAFTAITYGLGSVESYGYNAGTLVKTLNANISISNAGTAGNAASEYNCVGTPFRFTTYLPVKPSLMVWKFGATPNMTPNTDSVFVNPVPYDSTFIRGTKYYAYTVQQDFIFSAPGIYAIQLDYKHPQVEACDSTLQNVLYVQVVPGPKTNFAINFAGCEGNTAQFIGDTTTANGIDVNTWNWTFHNSSTSAGQNASFTYNTAGTYDVTLRTVTADGCFADSVKQVVVNPHPVVTLVSDSIAVCSGSDTTFIVQNPGAGVTYSWYTTSTGGTPVFTGDSFTVTNVTTAAVYYAEGTGAGCTSLVRKRLVVNVLQPLAPAVVATSSSTANSITFSWAAVPGATAYEVSINGATFITPSSGATGLTHTVTGISGSQSTCIIVRALADNSCQNSESTQVCGCTTVSAVVTPDSLSICSGATATFTVQNPPAGTTYTWYDAASGGNVVATGNPFTTPALSGPAEFWVEPSSGAGCSTPARTRVVVSILPTLAQPVVSVTGSTATSVVFSWPAVTGATGYEVSVNGGAFGTASTATTYTASGLTGIQSTCIVVRAVGTIACQNSESISVCGCNLATVTIAPDSLAICSGATATFTVQNPPAGTTYTWYDAATGGNVVGTTNPFTTPALSAPAQFWVEPSAGAGCSTPARTRVVVSILPTLAQPVVSVTGSTATSVIFSWPAVAGATGYEVSVNGGAFGAASTATTYTAAGITGLQSTCIVVRAVGANACQNSQSVSVCGCNLATVTVTPDSIAVCSGSTATFNVQSPVAGNTYTWFTQATGGTAIFTGTSFTTPAVTNTTVYFVEQSATGCSSASRTRVVVSVLATLPVPTPTFTSATPNSVTFNWPAVPGATGYQVSTDIGVTFGPVITGTTHTVSNLTPLQLTSIVVRAVGNIACQNSVSVPVSGRALGDQVFIPNTFTPNGDGLNDVLQVYGDVVRDLVFMVFNQWGEKIVESRDKNRIWDGTYKGKMQPAGVYIYVSRITLLDGTVIERKGSINLVR